MNNFTIEFAQKSAKEFFYLLKRNDIKKLIDIRLNNTSQLAGFANAKHLPYFLKIHEITYEYRPEFAPTKELFVKYKKEHLQWKEYVHIYNKILKERNILKDMDINQYEKSVFLCSEVEAKYCHRSLIALYLQKHFQNINIKHL